MKQQKLDLKITDDEYKKKVSEIKSGKNTPTVIIKATDDASYMNLIDALDEMQICNIGKYVITDIAEADEFLIKIMMLRENCHRTWPINDVTPKKRK